MRMVTPKKSYAFDAKIIREQPGRWRRYEEGMCTGCYAACCTMPLEVDFEDLVVLGLAHEDDNPKSVAKALQKSGLVTRYRDATQKYTMARKSNDDCIYLNDERRCTVYEKRPRVCREFPAIGSRAHYCPYIKNK